MPLSTLDQVEGQLKCHLLLEGLHNIFMDQGNIPLLPLVYKKYFLMNALSENVR